MERIRIELKDKDDNILQFVEGEVTKEMADVMIARFTDKILEENLNK